jgi:hypothetical protein
MTTETSTNRPTHRVYAVIKKEGQEKGTWLEIGAAWPHRDGIRPRSFPPAECARRQGCTVRCATTS